MSRSFLSVAVALTTGLVAQSPLETTFAFTAGNNFVVTNTPTPITGLFDLTVTEPTGIVQAGHNLGDGPQRSGSLWQE